MLNVNGVYQGILSYRLYLVVRSPRIMTDMVRELHHDFYRPPGIFWNI